MEKCPDTRVLVFSGHVRLEFIDKAMIAGRKGSPSLARTLFETDKDIEKLRADPRFPQMMEKYFGARGGKKPTPEGHGKEEGAETRKSGEKGSH